MSLAELFYARQAARGLGRFLARRRPRRARRRPARLEPLEPRLLLSGVNPLDPRDPAGRLLLEPPVTRSVSAPAPGGSVTIDIDAGQRLTLVTDPDVGLRPSLTVLDPSNTPIASTTAGGLGQNAILQAVPIAAAGTYTVLVSGANGTTGEYSTRFLLDAVA